MISRLLLWRGFEWCFRGGVVGKKLAQRWCLAHKNWHCWTLALRGLNMTGNYIIMSRQLFRSKVVLRDAGSGFVKRWHRRQTWVWSLAWRCFWWSSSLIFSENLVQKCKSGSLAKDLAIWAHFTRVFNGCAPKLPTKEMAPAQVDGFHCSTLHRTTVSWNEE